jgi:hypothetical protein
MGSRAGLDAVVKKNSQPLPGLEPTIIQPVSQRYTAELNIGPLLPSELKQVTRLLRSASALYLQVRGSNLKTAVLWN